MASLEIRGLCKSVGGLDILKGIDFSVPDREFLVLVGPSGCGKSTLLNMIAGLDSVTAGEIRIGDRLVNDVHAKDRDIAMVFQSYALYPNMTVRRNIAFALKMRGLPSAELDQAVQSVARLLQIEPLLDRKPAQLSGGQRQRVAMGRAMVRDPKVFLFDEPLSNLDALLRVEMRSEIKRLHARLQSTVVYVTHDQIEAMTLATRIAVMRAGQVVQLADPQTVYDRPKTIFVASFIGSPSTKFAKARLVGAPGAVVAEIAGIANAEGILRLPMPPEAGLADWIGRGVLLGIRPESLTEARDVGPHSARFDCEVEMIEPTGADVLTFIRLGGAEIIGRVSPARAVAAGQIMGFVLDMSKVNVFDPESETRISYPQE